LTLFPSDPGKSEINKTILTESPKLCTMSLLTNIDARRLPDMARGAATKQRTPFPTSQNAERQQTPIPNVDHMATGQQKTPEAPQQPTAFPTIQKVKLKEPTITEDNVRLRAYEIYLRGDNPGDDVGDWIQAERELVGD
jgi:hypothetical protein